ncbi:hypothetical protein ACIBG0_33165 [Nocardia sp. NPDC050630]|uniref:hypothetical protein n=1 Tax=Nocardia sp. NPDC050630 TaxID=3364321 RepID=UPI00379E2B8B
MSWRDLLLVFGHWQRHRCDAADPWDGMLTASLAPSEQSRLESKAEQDRGVPPAASVPLISADVAFIDTDPTLSAHGVLDDKTR